jgi:hypothetical protein
MTLTDFIEQGLAVRVEPDEAHDDGLVYNAKFEVISIVGTADGYKVLYEKCEDGAYIPTEDPDEAEVLLRGNLKWDGCSEMHIPEGSVFHVCGPGGYTAVAHVLQQLHRLCCPVITTDVFFEDQNLISPRIKKDSD